MLPERNLWSSSFRRFQIILPYWQMALKKPAAALNPGRACDH
jgi:hypothetical protein